MKISLPEDYSLVLQEVGMSGEEDIAELADMLSLDGGRLRHIIMALQHKGLIVMRRTGYSIRVRLSAKGQKLMTMMWPEAGLSFSY